MNRGALKTQAADFAGDPQMTRYSDTKYNTAANKAQEQFATDTRALYKDMTPVTTTAGDSTYDLPSDFILEEFVTYDGEELTPISRHEIQKRFGNQWDDEEGTPTHVLINPEEGAKNLILAPIPQDGKSLGMRYICLPAEMDEDIDTPLNGSALMTQFHMGLAAFMAWLLLGTEEVTPAIQAKRADLLRIYKDAVNKATEQFGNSKSAPIKISGGRFLGNPWS